MPNGEMGSPDVVSRKRSQVSVHLFALVVGVLIVLHRVGCQGRGRTSDMNGVSYQLLLVSHAFGGVAGSLVKGVFVPCLVIGQLATIIAAHLKV